MEKNPGIDISIEYNSSDIITSSLWSVGKTLIAGVLISMAVLFIFFGDFKASLIVGSSMPVSILATLILMSMMGYSMNIVTMGSLVIAIGMIVDNSIVVIEINIGVLRLHHCVCHGFLTHLGYDACAFILPVV